MFRVKKTITGVLVAPFTWLLVSLRIFTASAFTTGIFTTGIVTAARQATGDGDARVARLERWLKAVLHHAPGAEDAAEADVASWSHDELRALGFDLSALVWLMRDPTRVWSPSLGSRSRQAAAYTAAQRDRMRVLACAAAGTVRDAGCLRLNALQQMDAELARLAELAAASRRRGDDNYVQRRGALVHTDVAISGSEPMEPPGTGRGTGGRGGDPGGGPDRFQRLRVNISDGEQRDIGLGGIHWEIARVLLDEVRPGHDAMVRDWYRATAAWMQVHEHHDTQHLNHARAMFPDDADLLFLSGSQREAYASPAIQAVVRAAVLPSGFSLDVGSDRIELGEAESFFRRATALNPQLVEGRLRLGRVLLLRGKPQEAADQLHEVMTSPGEPVVRYYGALFLGAAEEELGHRDEARAWYTQAADLYPLAQSPHLALSALARRRGDRAGALREIEVMFELPSEESEFSDPWWTYHVVQARNAEELIKEVRERVR